MEHLIVAVLGLIVIAVAATLGDKIRVASPLLLVILGIVISVLPFVPAIEIEPEWILAGVLPPLLYSSAVSMPTMNFRREFTAISGLAVALVVVSAVLLGLLFAWLIPGLSLAWGIALGAIVSPTDAVATSIVKRIGVSSRVVSMLEGESLLNDATALVLLRSAIAATAAAVSFWGVLGNFLFSVVVAVIIGVIVGKVNLAIRSRISDATVNTVISFTVPFVASIPAELLGASGLVAAVVAGFVTGAGAARQLSARHRLSDAETWRTIELVLEGAIFLTMGLELWGVVTDVYAAHAGLFGALGIAGLGLLGVLVVRAAYVAPLLFSVRRRARRSERMKPRLTQLNERFANHEETAENAQAGIGRRGGRFRTPETVKRLQARANIILADVEYFLARPLGWREGSVIVWAGMRGAVTLAAAQTLPPDTPNRSLLVFIAFAIATGSLLIQGGTLAQFVSLVRPAKDHVDPGEHARLAELLRNAASSVPRTAAADAESAASHADGDVRPSKQHALAVISTQRNALLDARDLGRFSAESLNAALAVLDADQIRLELSGAPIDDEA